MKRESDVLFHLSDFCFLVEVESSYSRNYIYSISKVKQNYFKYYQDNYINGKKPQPTKQKKECQNLEHFQF